MSPAATVAPSESLTDTWAGRVEDYLRLRRSLGFALTWDEHLLRRFTADLARSGIAALTVADAVAWAGTLPAGQTHRPYTRAPVRLTAIRGFATYLHSLDPVHEVPPRDVFGWRKTRPVPYIYTPEEIAALLDACTDLIRYGRRHLYPVLFGLIAATGLRLGEALGLAWDEVDLDDGILTITRGKSRDPRLVPLHPTTTDALRDYVNRIAQPRRNGGRVSQTGDGARLFTLPGGGPLPPCNVHHAFRQVTTWTGLRAEQVWPRIHDLRHTFAVNTLLGWHRDGADVAAMMPVLSTYLGHTHPANTYWYLTATPELMAHAAGCLAISQGEDAEGLGA
jgi:integrase/recombinase XerD